MCNKYFVLTAIMMSSFLANAGVRLDLNYGERAESNIITLSDLTSSKIMVSASGDSAFDKTVELDSDESSFTDPGGFSGNLKIEFSAFGDGAFAPPEWGSGSAKLAFSGSGWGVVDSSPGQMINNDEAIVMKFNFDSLVLGRNPVILESLEIGMGKDFELWKKTTTGKATLIASGNTEAEDVAKINARVSAGDEYAFIMPKAPGRLKFINLDIKRYIPTTVKEIEVPKEIKEEVASELTPVNTERIPTYNSPVQTPISTPQQPVATTPTKAPPVAVSTPSFRTTKSFSLKDFNFNLTGLATILLLPFLRKKSV